MSPTSAPKGNDPGTRTDASADGTGVVRCPGQAVLVSECLWDRQPWCYGDSSCCLLDNRLFDELDNDPF